MERLTELMEELLNDSEQRKCLGQEAQKICDRFHPEKVFKQWDEVMQEVMNKKGK
ncbi:MAG: hypothetical protein ACKOAD_07805 [Gammaproteobacteria bacterium]